MSTEDDGIAALREMAEYVDEEVLLSTEGLEFFLERTKLSREQFIRDARKVLEDLRKEERRG